MSYNSLHHVTAISGPARRNLIFYTDVLGLRLVKKTVNFDDPGTYHLYYGDEAGQPGTILTFFPWDHAAPGQLGVGQTQLTSFRVARSSIGFWTQRFVELGVPHTAPVLRFGETVLAFKDPDGMPLALIGVAGLDGTAGDWPTIGVPAEHTIRGFHGVSLLLRDAAATAAILTDVFGFTEIGREANIVRYGVDSSGPGSFVDLHAIGDFPRGRLGKGSVHHVAFRASSDAEQAEMVSKLAERHGMATTEQKDRQYFRSVYFREPGGVLFEIATDDPGFAVDEPQASLGQSLKLPPFLEGSRTQIEAGLPALS